MRQFRRIDVFDGAVMCEIAVHRPEIARDVRIGFLADARAPDDRLTRMVRD